MKERERELSKHRFKLIQTYWSPHADPNPAHRPIIVKTTISTVVKTHARIDLSYSKVLNCIAFQILNMQASKLSERDGHRRESWVLREQSR